MYHTPVKPHSLLFFLELYAIVVLSLYPTQFCTKNETMATLQVATLELGITLRVLILFSPITINHVALCMAS